MKQLLEGIVDFRKKKVPLYRERFQELAEGGQSPRFLFFACADSRVITTMIASTEPGDIFLVRNVGNFIPKHSNLGAPTGEVSEAAAIEFALSRFDICDIIVCGHSECGAMVALTQGVEHITAPSLRSWLSYGEDAVQRLKNSPEFSSDMPLHNRLSRINVLAQIDHLKSYPMINDQIKKGALRVHGWWFDIAKADVYGYDDEEKRYILIDESGAQHFMTRL